MDTVTSHGGRQALTSLGNLDPAIITPRGGIQDSVHAREDPDMHGRKPGKEVLIAGS